MEFLTENWELILAAVIFATNPSAQWLALLGKPKVIRKITILNNLANCLAGNHSKEKSRD